MTDGVISDERKCNGEPCRRAAKQIPFCPTLVLQIIEFPSILNRHIDLAGR